MRRDAENVVEVASLYGSQLPWPEAWSVAGVIEVLEPLTLPARCERILAVTDQRLSSVSLVIDAPHDPHNGAAIVRSCDAFGVQQVHVVPREETFLVSTGVAKGTERWVDVVVHGSPEDAAETLREQGYSLVATHPQGELVPEDLARLPRVALVLGNEFDGIRPALAAACEHAVRIPMRGFVESLNVSVSAAILLAAATRDRPGDLTPDQRRRLYARGLFRSVHRAGEILANLSPR